MSSRKRRFRWQRWGWMRRLAAGLAVLAALAPLAAALFYAFAVRPDRQSVPYRRAMERLRANRSVARLLGAPVETGWWVRGHAGADSARLAVPVSGSRSEGILRVEAQRAGNGAWTFSHLVLDVTDNTMRLSLLEKERRRKKQSPPPPIKVPPRYQE